MLDTWPGTLVVASHDRAFLERTVEDVIVLDGHGRARKVPGGYAAYEADRRARRRPGRTGRVSGVGAGGGVAGRRTGVGGGGSREDRSRAGAGPSVTSGGTPGPDRPRRPPRTPPPPLRPPRGAT